jgi:hypothetical protein
MTKTPRYQLLWINGVSPKNHRGLAWLTERPESDEVNARAGFKELPWSPEQRQLLSRFDSWLEWKHKESWYHGWPNEEDYEDVWQFRYDPYRLMGFLCHPDPTDGRFQLCVLVRVVTKHAKLTDTTLKKHMQAYADDLDIQNLYDNIQDDEDDKNKEEEEKKSLDE